MFLDEIMLGESWTMTKVYSIKALSFICWGVGLSCAKYIKVADGYLR